MSNPDHYDAVIIGSGQAGGPLSTALAGAGRHTVLIERTHVGGTCINEGCTPTKTMVASARIAYLARRAHDFGVDTGSVHVDMVAVRRRKRDIVASFRENSTTHIRDGGVDLIMGEARFTGAHAVAVRLNEGEERHLTADLIVIDTGSHPTVPPIPGLNDVPYLDSTSIMELDVVPEHLLVLGGSYIGLEFAQMFRRFGSAVTVIEMAPQLLPREDRDVAEAVACILREDGITIMTDASAKAVERAPEGGVRLCVRASNGERLLDGSHLLVAVGRTPNTRALDLDAAGIAHDDRGYIQANDRLETNVPGVYAAGEVAGSPQFTHIVYDDFRILRANLLEGGNRTRKGRLVPYVLFIDPQLGRVGLGEDEARKAGRDVRVATLPMTSVARALEVGEARGMVKAIVDAHTQQILGATVLGFEGGEVMAMFEIAMMGSLPYPVLRDGIFAHPTLAELMSTLFDTLA